MILADKTMKWFKLAKDPFSADLGSRKNVYVTRAASIAEMRICKAINEHLIAALIGDVGSGKSTLLEKIIDETRRDKTYRIVRTCMLDKNRMTISHINEELIRALEGTKKYAGLVDKSHIVREAFEDIEKRGQKVMLVIDEAHHLPSETLRHLKALHEIQGKFHRPLAIILVGQPKLQRRMAKEVNLKEVLDRCEVIEMPSLVNERTGAKDDALDYLGYKLRRAGDRSVADVFTPDGLEKLLTHPAARTPLGMNNLVSRAMNVACEIKEAKISVDVMTNAFTDIAVTPDQADDDQSKRVRGAA